MIKSLSLLTLLFGVLLGPFATAAEGTIGFNSSATNHVRLTDPGTGRVYIAALEPDPDVHGTVQVVDLVLTRESRSDQNLLAPSGTYHGLQPYNFTAIDLRQGPKQSVYGALRQMPIRRTATKLVVTITDVKVRDVKGITIGEVGSAEIASLSLNLSLEGSGRQPKSK